jgi:hypothetical protein
MSTEAALDANTTCPSLGARCQPICSLRAGKARDARDECVAGHDGERGAGDELGADRTGGSVSGAPSSPMRATVDQLRMPPRQTSVSAHTSPPPRSSASSRSRVIDRRSYGVI